MRKIQITAVVLLMAALASTAGATAYTWVGLGGGNTAYTNSINWNPVAVTGGPGTGDTGTGGGTYAVGIKTENDMNRKATITMNDRSSILRNSNARMTVSGELVWVTVTNGVLVSTV